MTICIAALAKDDERGYIVFATDHMVTTNQGQFEHSIFKYKQINKTTIAMLSGNLIIFEDLIKLDKWDGSFSEIKRGIFQNFKKKKEEIIQNEIFNKFMIDKEFFVMSIGEPNPNHFIGDIIKTVVEFQLKTNILLVGFEDNEGMISVIDENGYYDFKDISFHAIGSGYDQAINTLMFQRHSSSETLSAAIYNVYKAKRNSEVKQGVGKETEVLVLCEEKLTELDSDQLSTLEKIYDSELKYGKEHNDLKEICK